MIVHDYKDSTALITGGTGGIGLEIAAQMAEAGVPRVAINGRTAERGEAALANLKARVPGCDFHFIAGDPRDYAEATKVVETAVAALGNLNILVSSVPGHLSPQPFHKVLPEAFAEQMNSHFGSVINICHAAMPHLIGRDGGTIINIASDAAKVATPGEAIQGALKAAVVMFSRTLALEASRSGIRVHAITPSIVRDTSAYQRVMASEFSQRLFAKAEAKAKLGVAEPADIAPLAVFLAGPGAARMTGQAISVNGGISAA